MKNYNIHVMHNKMEALHHELSVLAKAVHFKNISTAASNIGLSQPQISRIVARLEQELEVELLDRGSKRNATWTTAANQLSDLYKSRIRSLNDAIFNLVQDRVPKFLHVATLEGLIPFACDFCHELLSKTELEGLELNVYDLSLLEERFVKHKVDIVITSREPGLKKYKQMKQIGYQKLENMKVSDEFDILSTYQQNQQNSKLHRKPKSKKRTIVSNSLDIRKRWLKDFGGQSVLPSTLHFKKASQTEEARVILLAQDDFNHQLWKIITDIDLEGKNYENEF